MGDCGRIMQITNCATAAAQDMSDAHDIVRRFEQLETQWMSFQKRSAKLEGDKDIAQKAMTSSPCNHLQKCAVSSAASSYSNPLFTNHSTAKSAQTTGDKASSSSSRTSNLYAGSEIKIDRAPFSCFRQKDPGALASSPRDATSTKDDHSSSLGSPSTSVVGSSCQNSEKAFKDGQVSPSTDTMVTRATLATFFRDKPPLGPAVQTISKAPNIGNEKYVSCASSITRHTFRKRADQTRELQSSFKQQEILGLECPPQSTSMTRSSSGDDFPESDAEMIESLHSITYPSNSDPGTYSPGNGPSESHLSSSGLEQSSDAHINQSRSPPSAPQTSATVATSQLNPLLGYDGVSDRNISWRVLEERGVLSEGSFRMDRHSSEHHDAQCKSEEEKGLSNDKLIQNVTGVSSKDCNLLKPEAQIDQKNVFEAEHEKPSDRLDKVNWELRLSKREAALRIAEEKILEEEQNISQARLAVSRCEDSLRHREQDLQRESEKQKIDLGESLKSIETGKTVMRKLCTGLKDVLWHLEQKEKVLQNTWLEVKGSVGTGTGFGDHAFGFEPELSLKDKRSRTFDGISFLTAEGNCEEWCSTVVGICERLVTFMSRETHLQKWATVLEREGIRMGKMTKEMAKAKEAANEQCARSEDMMKCAEEQAACMDEERVKLARERDNLILWVTHLQERRKAVAECEREAAKSLADVQKKAADLFVHESNIDEKALEISALQEELRVTSQRLQDDQELINREKHKVQEKMRLIAGREREVEIKISFMKKLQEDLNTKAEQVEKDRVDENRKELLLLTFQETEKRINAKEMSVRELEKELEHKAAAVEEMTNNVNDREKSLAELQLQMEQERSRVQELMTGLEKEKVRLKEAEEAVIVAHCSKKSAEEAWARTAQERRESSEYLRSVEDRLKQWEDKLLCKEKELQGQQKKLQEIENQAKEEQEQSEALHAKLVQEQESWTHELKVKQESLTKRNRVLDVKEEEINNDLDRLTEERRVALEDIKRLAEMEARAWGAERELQTKHDEHLKEVRKHADDYNTQVEDLVLAKREVKKEFEELRAKKQELKIWQREAEETLQNRIDSFVKGKEELTAQIKELKKLQTDIEQAGSQIIDRVAELDQASSRLERQRHKVETSKKKLEALADKLATHQEVLKRRECEFLTQESKLVAVQNGLKKMAAEAATKEKNLRSREQAVIDSENDLHDVEARLANERKDLEKMLAEVEQHAAKLKEETTSVEEISRSRTRDELLIEERREQLQSKERELAEFETDLKKKAKSLEEHGQTISKLEMQVKERLQRAVDFETKSEELEKGWKQFAIKREALNRIETEIQRRAENDDVQRQLYSEIDEGKRKVEVAHWMSKSNKQEARLDYQHVFKELKTEDVLVLNKMDEGIEDRLKHMEEAFQKEAVKISQERANLKLQQQDLEETRKAVEEVKLTLEVQLKATKEIVAGASLTAQNASRERETLEEERKRLAQDRTDAEAAAAAKEEKLAMKAKHLENMKSMLDQEKVKAMEMIQQAAKKAMRAEHAKAESSDAQRDSMMLHKEIQCEASVKNREKELYATAESMRKEKTNLKEEKAQVKFLDDALEREQMEHLHVNLKNPTKVDALIKNAENQMTWKEMKKDRCIGDGNGWELISGGSPNDRSHVAEREFSFSTMRSASEINGGIGDFGEGSGRHTLAFREPAHYIIPKTEWTEALGSATPSIHATYNQITPEKMTANSSSPKFVEKNGSPSQKRLENVMTSLMQARQASRSRLQRTKNALLAFPPSSGFIIQVQQALNALSARLSLMEQIEEGLESHLRNAYETELPESERVLVDKVQLLCRMEEQQSLRVEWEEDMQRQLETISMLQAASRSSPSFSTPPRDPNHGVLPMNDWQNHNSNVYEDGKGQGSYEMLSSGNAEVNLSADLYNGGMSRPSQQFANLNWNKVFEPNDNLDSPLVAHGCSSNPADQHSNELGTHELQNHQRSTRRKLLLSSPQLTYA